MVYDLAVLKYEADLIVKAIVPGSFGGAINWADLSCVSARFCRDSEDSEWYEVQIEEASPEASILREYIGTEMEKREFVNIVVITDW